MTNITEGNGVLIVCSCGRRVRPATARNGKCPGCGKKLPGLSPVTTTEPRSNRRILGVFIVLLATTTALLST